MAEVLPVALPPEEAIQYFRRKGYHTEGFDWRDVYAEEHARVFTVAKATQLDVLTDIRSAVDKAIAEGTTLAQFRRELEPTLQEKGWWGRKKMVDPLTGEEREVQLGSPRRLRTIYDTNLRAAHAAGKWEQIERTKERRPYLRYVAILDDRTRPAHRGWHGTVLPADDPWWQTHYPPNGWNCRCSVQQLGPRDLERYGYQVDPEAPASPTREWINPRTGEVRDVPAGIDPGFDYNVGRAASSAASFTQKIAIAPPPLGAAAWDSAAPRVVPALEQDYASWVDGLLERTAKPTGERLSIGGLSPRTLQFLQERGHDVASAAITISDRDVLHLLRPSKSEAGRAVPAELVRRFPTLLREPRAVLWDRTNPALVYVFDVPGEARAGKVVVRVNYETRVRPAGGGKKSAVLTNQVRTAGLVPRESLQNSGVYDIVEGRL